MALLAKPFRSSRGLRQGDPLSPMVFILTAQGLSQCFLTTQANGVLSGFKVSDYESGLPILQFVDDTLILINGVLKEVNAVKNILILFEGCTSLKVNTQKTIIYKVNEVADWDRMLGFGVVNLVLFPMLFGASLGSKVSLCFRMGSVVGKRQV